MINTEDLLNMPKELNRAIKESELYPYITKTINQIMTANILKCLVTSDGIKVEVEE